MKLMGFLDLIVFVGEPSRGGRKMLLLLLLLFVRDECKLGI